MKPLMVSSRLDSKPELLFLPRGVDHGELVGKDAAKAVVSRQPIGSRHEPSLISPILIKV